MRDLLSMNSGIPDYNIEVAGRVPENPARVWTADELIQAAIGSRQALGAVGPSAYSNTNYILLQEVAEEITGQPLQQLIAERVTGPLGLTHTILRPDADSSLPMPGSHGYLNDQGARAIEDYGGRAEAGTDTTDWNMSYGQGAGGMSATIADLGRWGASELGGGLLQPSTARDRPKFVDDYGLGSYEFSDGALGHNGVAYGWEAVVTYNPAIGRAVAMATNACDQAGYYIFDKIQEGLTERLPGSRGPLEPPSDG